MRLTLDHGPARGGAVFLFVSCALAASMASARELVVEAAPCSERIRIHAREVPLQDVVSALASAMGVKLAAQAPLPELVSIDVAGAPEEVLKRILQGKNLVTETKAVPACGSREVLATIWLLPVGQEGVRAPAAADAPRIERAGEQPEFRSHERNSGKPRPTRKAGRPRDEAEEAQAGEASPDR